MKAWRVLSVGLAFALLAAACGGGGYSSNPDAYMPDKVGDKQVNTKSQFAKSLETFFEGGQVQEFASGTVGTPDRSGPLPDLTVLAARGEQDSIQDAQDQVKQAFAGGEGEAKIVKIEGLDVQMMSFSQSGRSATIATAAPRSDIGLVVFALDGGEEQATQGMGAMLDAGKL